MAAVPERPLTKEEKEIRRQLRDHDEAKEDVLANLKHPVLPTGWDETFVEYQLNDGSVGLDEADRFEPVALVKASNPCARRWIERIVERNNFYNGYISTDEQDKVTVMAFTTGDDFLKGQLTSDLKKAIAAELTQRWDELRQKGLIESQRQLAVVTGTLDQDKIARPLEPANIYKPGFFSISQDSPGSVPIARFSRSLFENSTNRLECLRELPCPTSEARFQAYLASGREGTKGHVAIPFQFWCQEVMVHAGKGQ